MGKKFSGFFSASGVTEKVAKVLTEAENMDLYEIKPKRYGF